MLDFVQKNKTIPNIIDEIKHTAVGQAKQTALLEALASADMNNVLFSDPDCYLIAHTLYTAERITHESYMTTLLYLAALQQYTDKQPLKDCDSDLKESAPVKFHSPSQNAKSAAIFSEYINQMLQRAAELGIILDESALMKSAAEFQGSESGFITVDLTGILKMDPKKDTAQNLNDILRQIHRATDQDRKILERYQFYFYILRISPIFQIIPSHSLFVIPSMSWIKLIQNKVNPDLQFQAIPTLGGLKPETLFHRFHQQRAHPVMLYSPHITSNPKTVHAERTGPLFAALHDLAHIFVATYTLKNNDAKFLLDELMPFILTLKQAMILNGKSAQLIRAIDACFERLNDLDVTTQGVLLLADSQDEFYNYLGRCISNGLKSDRDFIPMLCLAFRHTGNQIYADYALDSEKLIKTLSTVTRPSVTLIIQKKLKAIGCLEYPSSLKKWDVKAITQLFKILNAPEPTPNDAPKTLYSCALM